MSEGGIGWLRAVKWVVVALFAASLLQLFVAWMRAAG